MSRPGVCLAADWPAGARSGWQCDIPISFHGGDLFLLYSLCTSVEAETYKGAYGYVST